MGRNRRQRRLQERRAERAAPPEPAAPATGGGGRPPRGPSRPGWRQTLDRWGGLPILGAILVAVVVVVVLIALNAFGDDGEGGDEYTPVARSQVDGRVEGSPDAPVRITDLSDFQCPHCKRFVDETHPILLEEYVEEGLVAIEFHHLPVLGDGSLRAAEAAECALDQGHFWDMHDLLFLRQGAAFTYDDLKGYGDTLAEHFDDFDTAAFDACLDSGEKRPIVQEMAASAQGSGIQSTPTFIINGKVIAGAQPIEAFREVIDEQLVAAEAGAE